VKVPEAGAVIVPEAGSQGLRPLMLYKFLHGSFQLTEPVFDFKFWTGELPITGQFKNVGSQHERRIEGHTLGFVRGMTGGERRPIRGGDQ